MSWQYSAFISLWKNLAGRKYFPRPESGKRCTSKIQTRLFRSLGQDPHSVSYTNGRPLRDVFPQVSMSSFIESPEISEIEPAKTIYKLRAANRETDCVWFFVHSRVCADKSGPERARSSDRGVKIFLARWPLAGSLESASSAPQTSSQLHNSVHFLIWLSNLSELALMLSKLLEKGVLRAKIILCRRLQYYLNDFDVSSKEKSFERISHSCSRAFLSYVGIAKRARSFGLTMPRA